MYKEFIKNSLVKDLMIIRRLITKIPADRADFRPQENMRSTIELLRYLSNCGTGIIRFWNSDGSADFRTFYIPLAQRVKDLDLKGAIKEIEEQIVMVEELFEQITDEDLLTKEVQYPGGEKGLMGEALINTCIKWLAAYKLQLFVNIKMSTGQQLATPDLWRKTELEEML
jgi:hypothetical protein